MVKLEYFFYPYGLKYAWDRIKEDTAMFFAWHILPYEVRKWVVIRAVVDYEPDGCPTKIDYSDLMERMK